MKKPEEILDPITKLSTLANGKSVIVELSEIYKWMDEYADQFRLSPDFIGYMETHFRIHSQSNENCARNGVIDQMEYENNKGVYKRFLTELQTHKVK